MNDHRTEIPENLRRHLEVQNESTNDTEVEEHMLQKDLTLIRNEEEAEDVNKIDPRGDVLVRSGPKRLLVSSNVLSMASPVFDATLNGDFREGKSPRSVEDPLDLHLQDDDPEALLLFFQVLHYKFPSTAATDIPDVDRMVQLALISDKYLCIDLVRFISATWISKITFQTAEQDRLLKLLLIAYVLKMKEEFESISSSLAYSLNSEDLKTLKLHEVFPHSLRADLGLLRYDLFHNLLAILEELIQEIRVDDRCFDTRNKICISCRCHKPPATKVCHSCHNREFEVVQCTSETRLDEFFGTLVAKGIWPFSQRFKGSVQAVCNNIPSSSSLGYYGRDHTCSGGGSCPLNVAFENMRQKFAGILKGSKNS
ncbi:MAG: hypothetical protein M1834_008288 [Cirrosporium novae-zelandiae]|nr:MAG: hypothetical protein M1834_008288 [Cirrosporium novae-zelandiae]